MKNSSEKGEKVTSRYYNVRMSIRCFLHIVIFLFAGLVAVVPACADDTLFINQQRIKQDLLNQEHLIVKNVEEAKKDGFVAPSILNLSKLYWAIGKLDIENDSMVDSFLMISECELYTQYFHNEFEWMSIRDATRQHILDNLSEFPTRFEILSPVELGRYDMEREVFEVADDYKISGLRRIIDFQMNNEAHKKTCFKKGEIYDYPSNLIIILNRPLFLEEIPVKRELARLYIDDTNMFYDSLPKNFQVQRHERFAFLRLKIRITQYKNTVRVIGGDLRAVVFGQLEGYEVYADEDKLKPLYYKNTKKRRFSRIKKDLSDEEEATEGAMEVMR